jgi:hypothetical protein
MKPLSGQLFALCLLAANLSCAAADDVRPRFWSYQYAFATSNDPRQFDPLLRHMKLEEELRENALLDYVAEALVSQVNRDIDSESLALLADTLSDLGHARYLTVFMKVSHQTKWPTVRSIADKYVHKHQPTSEPQYVPGTIDLMALRAAYATAALAATPSEAVAQRLASLSPGSSIDQLFALAGKPQAVVSGQTKATDGLLIHIKIQRLAFYYRGVGRVIFGYRNSEGWKSQGVVIDPEAFEGLMPYRNHTDSAALLGDGTLGMTQLLNNHLSAMKVAVEGRWRNGGASAQFLDTTAEVLLEQHASATLPGCWLPTAVRATPTCSRRSPLRQRTKSCASLPRCRWRKSPARIPRPSSKAASRSPHCARSIRRCIHSAP